MMSQQEVIMNSVEEGERIETLRKYEILDTPPDGSFDRITKLAAQLLQVPVAIVTLVDTDRIWFKSKYGLDIPEIPRDPGLCASAILQDDLYIVEDARRDPRTLANPLVAGEFGLQFYSAVPLKTREGHNLGTLCVIDKKPRELAAADKEILKTLGELVMDQMELQLEARTAIRHQNEILNTAAHDLKNPISIMPLLADLIMSNKDNPEAIDDISKQIKAAGRRMAQTINELLENSKEDAGNMHLRLQACELQELVQGVVKANQALARKKDQQLSFICEQGSTVYADQRRLTEVVDNLINNAIKYSQYEKKIEVLLTVKDGKAVIKVADQGLGLSQDDLNNLYRRFTSLSAKPTGGEISTGLGLSISKEVINAHQGILEAFSEGLGKGSTFRIELPLAQVQEKQ